MEDSSCQDILEPYVFEIYDTWLYVLAFLEDAHVCVVVWEFVFSKNICVMRVI